MSEIARAKLDYPEIEDVSAAEDFSTSPSLIRSSVSFLILAASVLPGCAGRIGTDSNRAKDVSALIDRKEIESDIKEGNVIGPENGSEEDSKKRLEKIRKSAILIKAYVGYLGITHEFKKELNSKPINPANLQNLLLRLTQIEDTFVKEKPFDPEHETWLINVKELIKKVKLALDKNTML